VPFKKPRLGISAIATSALAVAVLTVGLGSSASFAAQPVASDAAVTAVAGQKCGQDVTFTGQDPTNVLKSLSPAARTRYDSWPFEVSRSPWSSFKGIKGKWKIGLVMFAPTGPWNVDVESEAKKEFAQAKKAGLVKGSLVTYISPSEATETPEQQISAIQSMVSQGVNGIMVLPIDGDALGPAVTAAGKAHVPVVTIDNFVPNSPYAINVWTDSSTLADSGVLGKVKKGNVLIVRGIAGNLTEQAFQNAAVANINACPGMNVVGTVFGNFSVATAKSAVTSFLTSHPGLPVNAVIQNGVMAAGVIDAFQSLGKPVPPISGGGCQGGDLSWWLAHKSSYSTTAQCYNGFQDSYDEMRILFRILGGKQVKLNSIALPAPVVTNKNLAQYATAGKSLDWTGEPRGPLNALCSEVCLNGYFKKPGTPKGF
jgi:ribose transport system substrate-binding protein